MIIFLIVEVSTSQACRQFPKMPLQIWSISQECKYFLKTRAKWPLRASIKMRCYKNNSCQCRLNVHNDFCSLLLPSTSKSLCDQASAASPVYYVFSWKMRKISRNIILEMSWMKFIFTIRKSRPGELNGNCCFSFITHNLKITDKI